MPTPPRRWFAFRLRTLFVVVGMYALLVWWAATFERRFSLLGVGWTRSQVRTLIGNPATVEMGPVHCLFPVAPTEEWVYKSGDREYFVIFYGTATEDRKVVGTYRVSAPTNRP